jgi:hypothetical protein
LSSALFEWIKDLFGRREDPELIRLKGGRSACAACGKPVRSSRIYKVPTIEKHYCMEHAHEEMEKLREQTFNLVPEKMKSKVKFSKDDAYYFECAHCQKKLGVLKLEWAQCGYCNKATCKDEMKSHRCDEMQAAELEKKEAEMPRRCTFCGTKIMAATSVKCYSCRKYYCQTHEKPEHHECRK